MRQAWGHSLFSGRRWFRRRFRGRLRAVPCKVVGFDCGKDSWIQRRVDSEPALEDGFIDRAVAGQLLKKFNY
jgi:hypothetical protein